MGREEKMKRKESRIHGRKRKRTSLEDLEVRLSIHSKTTLSFGPYVSYYK